jgi:hypothetical protein
VRQEEQRQSVGRGAKEAVMIHTVHSVHHYRAGARFRGCANTMECTEDRAEELRWTEAREGEIVY